MTDREDIINCNRVVGSEKPNTLLRRVLKSYHSECKMEFTVEKKNNKKNEKLSGKEVIA